MNHDKSQKEENFEEDDFNFEKDEEIVGEETSKDKIKILNSKLKTLVAEKSKLQEDLQRAKADFVNIRRRDEADLEKALKLANEALFLDIIPVLDSFEMAFAHPSWQTAPPDFREGVLRVYEQLKSTMTRNGVEILDPLGKSFDPSVHTAVTTIPTDKEEEDHTIVEVLQNGYRLDSKIIRSPKVKIKIFQK